MKKLRRLKRRFKASVRRRRYLRKKRKKARNDERFITSLLANASGALDHEYTSRGVEETTVKLCEKEEYLRILNLLDEINRRGKLFYDPIELVLYYFGKEDDEIVSEATSTEQIEKQSDSKSLETQLWVRYINGRTEP